MERLIYYTAGMIVTCIIDYAISVFNRIDRQKQCAEAENLLKKYNMSSHIYLPTLGIENIELRKALAAFNSRIIIDENDCIVGGIIPKAEKSCHLQLVVNNGKQND